MTRILSLPALGALVAFALGAEPSLPPPAAGKIAFDRDVQSIRSPGGTATGSSPP